MLVPNCTCNSKYQFQDFIVFEQPCGEKVLSPNQLTQLYTMSSDLSFCPDICQNLSFPGLLELRPKFACVELSKSTYGLQTFGQLQEQTEGLSVRKTLTHGVVYLLPVQILHSMNDYYYYYYYYYYN